MRALVVDDRASDREILHRYLSSWGMHNDGAANAREALELMHRAADSGAPYDIAVIDYSMPDVDGIELARAIRAERKFDHTRLVLLTAFDQRDLFDKAEAAGFSDYLTLVEDNLTNQKVAQLQLNKLGYAVHIVGNGMEEAVDAAASLPYAAILMDCQMPIMDGFEATAMIRKMQLSGGAERVPIIAMTANAMQGDRERCLEAGMDGYVSKPVKPEVLFQEIERVLGAQTGEATGVAIPEEPGPPIYDRADALSRIADDEELLATLIDMFVADAPNYLNEIDTALQDVDWPRLTRAAHTLKGVLATFSANRGEAVARALETAAKTADANACGKLAAQAKIEVEAFLRAIG